MKSILIPTLIGFFLISKLSAQTTTKLPEFSEGSVIMKISIAGIGESYVIITDGITSFELKIDEVTGISSIKKEKATGSTGTIATFINQLQKQGYKMITTNSIVTVNSTINTFNYFQKE
jgi:hypothetical protein